jgi:hypothetical protein
MGLSAICMAAGAEVTSVRPVPGFLIGTGGGIGLSACSSCLNLEVSAWLRVAGPRDNPHRVRVEIVRTFLIVMRFSISEMESRRQKRFGQKSFAQAARGCLARGCLLGIATRGKSVQKRKKRENSQTG